MGKLEIKLLGRFEASLDGRSIPLGGPKQQALFAYLAFHGGEEVSRAQLITLLWGDRFDTQANQSLRQALFRLRRVLDKAGLDLLGIDGELISLAADKIAIDLLLFQQEAESSAMADWQTAVARFDDLLAGFDIRQAEFEAWLAQARQQHELVADGLFDRLSAALLQADDFKGGLAIADRWIARDPINEPAQRRAIEICAAAGDRAGALKRFQTMAEMLSRELGVEPDPETQSLAEHIKGGEVLETNADEMAAVLADTVTAEPDVQQPNSKITDKPIQDDLASADDDASARLDGAVFKPTWMAAAVFIVAIIGGGAWWWLQQESNTSPGLENLAPSQSGKPSIAVLPFVNISNKEEQEYFADGMTDDLITDLSKVSGLTVVARNSVFTYKGKSAKVQEVAKDLNVSHVLEGSVRRAGNQVRINVQLIDAATGNHLWAETFDRDYKDIFKLQDEISGHIIAAMKIKLTLAEKTALADLPTKNVEAYDLFLQAETVRRASLAENAQLAFDLYAKAVALDPAFADAHAGDAEVTRYVWAFRFSAKPRGAAALVRANRSAERALALNPDQPLALLVLADIAMRHEQHGKALRLARQAVRVNPHDISARIYAANVLVGSSDQDEARRLVESITRDAPVLPAWDKYQLGVNYMWLRQPAAAVRYLTEAQAADATIFPGFMAQVLAVSYAYLGQMDLARKQVQRLLRVWPTSNYEGLRQHITFRKDPKIPDYFAEGLRLAGLPQWALGFEAPDSARVLGGELAKVYGSNFNHKGVLDRGTYHIDYVREWTSEREYVWRGQRRGSGKKYNSKGKMSIDRDRYCFISATSHMGRKSCWPLFRNPDAAKDGFTYARPDRFGISRFSLVPQE